MQCREGARARQVRLVTPTLFAVHTPGTPPGTLLCILVANRARPGAWGADGRPRIVRYIPGAGKGLGSLGFLLSDTRSARGGFEANAGIRSKREV